MSDPDLSDPTARPDAPGPGGGDPAPLSAAYCAERAAACIKVAETTDLHDAARWLDCARGWRELGCSMATNPTMNRPREEGPRR